MVTDSLFINACRGRKTARPPVWIMRQAGRYLPEYRALREKHSMLDVIRTPELAAEVTFQPLRRFPLDASIIFADILNPLIGLGFELEFIESVGPVIHNRIASAADVERIHVPPVEENVGYTLKALQIVSQELATRGLPVLGFSGSPFTLSYYLIEGSSKQSLARTKRFMFSEPEAWAELQEKLVTLVADYLVAQVEAGAAALQLFDSWAGQLSPSDYVTGVLPWITKIIHKVRARTQVPLIYFAPGALGVLPLIGTLGVDVVGIDWRITLPNAQKALHIPHVLQGNVDPAVLFTPLAHVEQETRRVIEEGRALPGHIMNLGHGIMPETPIDAVTRLVNVVHEYSA